MKAHRSRNSTRNVNIRRGKQRAGKTNGAFKGAVKIGPYSGLRKLARAMRRGLVPPERQFIIDQAMKRAAERLSLSATEGDTLKTADRQ